MSEIAGRNIVITGAASGIGRLMALEFAERGGNGVAWDLDGPGLERLLSELRPLGGRPRADVVDVTDRARVYAAAAQVKAELGPVGILVNNAGVVTGSASWTSPTNRSSRRCRSTPSRTSGRPRPSCRT